MAFQTRSIASAVAAVDPSAGRFETLEAARASYLAARFNDTVKAAQALAPRNPVPPPKWCKTERPAEPNAPLRIARNASWASNVGHVHGVVSKVPRKTSALH